MCQAMLLSKRASGTSIFINSTFFQQNNNQANAINPRIKLGATGCLSHQAKCDRLVCKSFYITESKHCKKLKPLRQEHLPAVLIRYSNTTHLDLSLYPRINDHSLFAISKITSFTLQSIDLSRSWGFSSSGLLSLTLSCKNLE